MNAWFYNSRGTAYDRAIGFWTGSSYVHVELHFDGFCHSSSPRDGGVRRKQIKRSGNWIILPIKWATNQTLEHARQVFKETNGCRYDWPGIFFSQIIAAGQHSRRKFFCSEWCAKELGLEVLVDPGTLYKLIEWRNTNIVSRG